MIVITRVESIEVPNNIYELQTSEMQSRRYPIRESLRGERTTLANDVVITEVVQGSRHSLEEGYIDPDSGEPKSKIIYDLVIGLTAEANGALGIHLDTLRDLRNRNIHLEGANESLRKDIILRKDEERQRLEYIKSMSFWKRLKWAWHGKSL